MSENVVKQRLQASIKGRVALTDIRTPELIVLGEAWLEGVKWKF